jgi:hypothetical protein
MTDLGIQGRYLMSRSSDQLSFAIIYPRANRVRPSPQTGEQLSPRLEIDAPGLLNEEA